MTTTAQTAVNLIGSGHVKVYIQADDNRGGTTTATLAYACNVLDRTIHEAFSSLMVVGMSGRLSLLIGVKVAYGEGDEALLVQCKRLEQIELESPAPEAVLVAARMLGGMASATVD